MSVSSFQSNLNQLLSYFNGVDVIYHLSPYLCYQANVDGGVYPLYGQYAQSIVQGYVDATTLFSSCSQGVAMGYYGVYGNPGVSDTGIDHDTSHPSVDTQTLSLSRQHSLCHTDRSILRVLSGLRPRADVSAILQSFRLHGLLRVATSIELPLIFHLSRHAQASHRRARPGGAGGPRGSFSVRRLHRAEGVNGRQLCWIAAAVSFV